MQRNFSALKNYFKPYKQNPVKEMSIPVYSCSASEKVQVTTVIDKLVAGYEATAYLHFSKSCELASQNLPEGILKWSEEVKRERVGVIKNLPVDINLPPTPVTRFAMDPTSMFSDKVVGCISSLFGKTYTFEGKQVPRHITNLYPIRDDFGTQLASSDTELEWHVEDGFHSGRPEWVGLLCLRSDPNVWTKLARAIDLDLPETTNSILRQQIFSLQVDDTYKVENISHVLISILSGSEKDPDIIYDPAYTFCQDSVATKALADVKRSADAKALSIGLEKGDMLLFNNRKTIHARSSYRPSLDGTDRWLKRALIIGSRSLVARLKDGFMPLS